MLPVAEYFATCPKGLESLLAAEINQLTQQFGPRLEPAIAEGVRETVAGVYFQADQALAYRVCLWSRLANKVLLPLARFDAGSAEDLYRGARAVPWREHLNPGGSLAVEFTGTSAAIRNSQFGAVTVKDAIVDCLRDDCGRRPSVDKRDPDVRINAHLGRGRVVLGLDLSGDSLHRRGYRARQGAAPLKENLAAAVLLRAGWPATAAAGGALLDPMCGSGTLLIEAALMAADIAPGLLRPGFGFERWLNHRNDIWLALREEALARRERGLAERDNEIRGYDADVGVIRAAEANIVQAGLGGRVRIVHKSLREFKQPTHKNLDGGLVISNPPYGERLGEREALKGLYRQLGQRLKAQFQGWRAAVLTGNPDLGKQMGLRAHKKYKLFNGALPSELLLFDIDERAFVESRPGVEIDAWAGAEAGARGGTETGKRSGAGAGRWPGVEGGARTGGAGRADAGAPPALTPGAQMVVNRLRKNRKALVKWLQREAVSCYRLYDADMPEYALAVDIYEDLGGAVYAHVQEYAAPKSVEESKAQRRLEEFLAALPVALDIDPGRISVKQRRRNRGARQYRKQVDEQWEYAAFRDQTPWQQALRHNAVEPRAFQSKTFLPTTFQSTSVQSTSAQSTTKARRDGRHGAAEPPVITVREGQAQLAVDLWRYLDTGLFLDHRPLRKLIAQRARGQRFLNLFCYTASATVHAALGDAAGSVSVDMSRTYLDWARKNFALNNIAEKRHRLIQADCFEWLKNCREPFDLILLDPPSFSNSKRMEGVLDIQRDHADLISRCMELLNPGGSLLFSTNLRRFKLEREGLDRFDIEDITAATLDEDFRRSRGIHQCFIVRHGD